MTPALLSGRSRVEWDNLIAAVDATLTKQRIPVPTRIAIVAQAPKTPETTPRAPMPATPKAQDPATMSTEDLWAYCATIKHPTKRTLYFRAHIRPRMRT